MVGIAGIAPLSVTVIAPQAFANRSASLSFFSSCKFHIIDFSLKLKKPYTRCNEKSFYVTTFRTVRSEAKLFNRPLTNASPAPVVSTGFTFTPATLPLNSYKTDIATRICNLVTDQILKTKF